MPMHEYFMGMTQLELINRAPGFFQISTPQRSGALLESDSNRAVFSGC